MENKIKYIKIAKRIAIALFPVYMLILFLFVILKIDQGSLASTIRWIKRDREQGFWNYNIVPFRTIMDYMNPERGLGMENVLGNTVPFMPLGFFLGIIPKRAKTVRVFIESFLIILLLELIQLVFCIGFFDIDDIILNVISSMFGFLVFVILRKVISSYLKYCQTI